MKKAIAAIAMLGLGAVIAAPASAATTVYGSAQIKYTVNATAAVSIATNYVPATGAQAAGASTILPSVAGNCSAGVAETLATLTFGGITPPGAGYTGCYYQNAVSLGVESNDANGVDVYEFIDVAVPGTQICAFTLAAAFGATPSASGASGNPAAYTASCPTVNSVAGTALTAQGATTAGTGFGGAGAPGGTDVTATPTATLAGAVGYHMHTKTPGEVSGAAFKYIGQDIQVNVSGAAASGNQPQVITYAVIPG